MPCGKRPIVKTWDKPKDLRVIKPSRYQQNEASVKVHWKNVIRALEDSYKDNQFWETQCDTVRKLVGPVFFHRIAKIFNLPADATQYHPKSETTIEPSDTFYQVIEAPVRSHHSVTSLSNKNLVDILSEEEIDEDLDEEQLSEATTATKTSLEMKTISHRTMAKSKSVLISKIFSKPSERFSKYSKTMSKNHSMRTKSKLESEVGSADEMAESDDDLHVNYSDHKRKHYKRHSRNPHFHMLYCNESETDMIKWNSKYKQKAFEVSASDEFSKKAEIMTKQIAKEFFEWWTGLGNVEFKSEIKRLDDIVDLFQVWFDEHASRGIVLDPKILPCVLQSIADFVGVPKASCPKVLKRQIAYDIHAETSPAHTTAFNSSLPHKMKHIPPKNNTKEMWDCVKIPEELRSMSCVFDDIQHLTSTKAFQQWLEQRPHLPMPPCLTSLGTADKKQPFVIPSDLVVRDRSTSTSVQDLALPVSQFTLELKEVLSKIMNQ